MKHIKLLAVIGGFLGAEAVLSCMLTAFLAGGMLSLGLMLLRGNLVTRFLYFQSYVKDVYRTRIWQPYRKVGQEKGEFCFTIPVFFSVLCFLGGII